MEVSAGSGTPPGSAATDASQETDLARVTRERDEALAAERTEDATPVAEPGSAASTESPPPAQERSPLDALKAAADANPNGSITDHLKALADDGIRAVVNPQTETDILGALIVVVHDLIGKVKL